MFLCTVFQTLCFLAEFFLHVVVQMFSSNMLGLDSNPSAGQHPPSRYPPFFTNKPDVVAPDSASFTISDEVQSLRSYGLAFLHCNVAGPSTWIFLRNQLSKARSPVWLREGNTECMWKWPLLPYSSGNGGAQVVCDHCPSLSLPLWVPEALSLFGIKSISSYSDCTVAHGMLLLAPPPYLEV